MYCVLKLQEIVYNAGIVICSGLPLKVLWSKQL